MKIILILNQPYPKGYALTKRFHLYALGLIANGCDVKIFIPKPTERIDKNLNSKVKDCNQGIYYEYMYKQTYRSQYFLIRRWHDFIGPLVTGLKILREKPDAVICSSFSRWIILYLKILCKIVTCIYVREKNEVDFENKESLNKKELKKAIKLNSCFDAFIVISKKLEDYVKHDLMLNKPCINIPILVQKYNFSRTDFNNLYIVYSGTYIEHKDGILTFLMAFKIFLSKFPEYKLILTGSPNKSKDYIRISKFIEENNLSDNIVYTGYLEEDELNYYLVNSKFMVLTKPYNRQNQYNYPTKLGEYLMTGNPVIATKVGTVGEVFKNNINIIYANYNPSSIANCMIRVASDDIHSKCIGEAGKLYASLNLDYKTNAKLMLTYLENIRNENCNS